MLIGGLSLVAYMVVIAAGDRLELINIAWWMWLLAFFVNGPHFMISYEMFYFEFGSRVLRDFRVFWAGVIIPFVLVVSILCGVYFELKMVFLSLLYLMFFTVGWHYIKQAYGCFIVYSMGQGMIYGSLEKSLILFSLYPLWWSSFLRIFTGSGDRDFWGLKYAAPGFLRGWVDVIYYLSLLGVVPLFLIIVFKILRGGKWPGFTAVTPLIVIYVWLSPLLSNSYFLYMIPFFHSLQYFLFSGAYSRGKVEESGKGARGYMLWWGGAFVIGALLFELIPSGLDGMWMGRGGISPNLFLISFILFINIHHYFIDNVLWRGRDPRVRRYLKMRSKLDTKSKGIV